MPIFSEKLLPLRCRDVNTGSGWVKAEGETRCITLLLEHGLLCM